MTPTDKIPDSNKRIVPWGLHRMYPWVEDAIKSRGNEYGMNPVDFSSGPSSGQYAGPRSAWVRMFSNGVSKLESSKVKGNGFIMGGAETFEESYGFGSDKKITIGVDAFGNPHEIEALPNNGSNKQYDFPHRPPPSITSLTCDFSGAAGNAFNALCRKTTIHWRCYSLNQLNYLIPYFLSPRISLIIEWGWNNYNREVLINLKDLQLIKDLWENKDSLAEKRLEMSKGNYDFSMGFTTDYGYRLTENGGYDCYTTIMNPNFLIEGTTYSNSATKKKVQENKYEKMKDFVEFSNFDLDGMEKGEGKITSVSAPPSPRFPDLVKASRAETAEQAEKITNTYLKNEDAAEKATLKFNIRKGQVYSDNGDTWLRMDLVAEIINTFFKRQFKDSEGNFINVGLTNFDIMGKDGKGIPICAHPALKSTDENILIPNSIAPRFANSLKNEESELKLKNTFNNYNTLFPAVAEFIAKNKYTDEYDNIQEILKTDRSLPVYESNYNDNYGGYAAKGYYGYLNDVFVSVKLLKREIENQDTVMRLLNAILDNISRAMCNLPQFKIVTAPYNQSAYSVIDVNFSTTNTKKQAASLPKFTVNAAEDSSMKTARFEIKISPEMMNNMIMLSANKQVSDKQVIKQTYDNKIMHFDDNLLGDRLFDYAQPRDAGPSNESEESKKAQTARLAKDNPAVFRMVEIKKKATIPKTLKGSQPQEKDRIEKYIIAEKDSTFLKNVIIDINNARSIYTEKFLMPGTEFHADLLGIGGITYLSQFTLDHVPSTYNYENGVWQIADVKQKIENKMWITSIMAQCRPLSIITDTEEKLIKK